MLKLHTIKLLRFAVGVGVEADQGADALPGELLVTLARNPARTVLRQPVIGRKLR